MKQESFGKKQRALSYSWARTKATKEQWELVDIAIGAFIKKYPTHWIVFLSDLSQKRSKYNLAKEGGLKKANFRNVAAFPVIYNKQGREIDSLLPVLKKIIPELTHKNSINFQPFIKKYSIFLPGEKF